MMGILLAAGLSLMGATIVDQKVALESGDSIQALQNAESGTEVAVSVLSGNFATDPTKDQLFEVFDPSTFTCNGGKVTQNGDSSYKLTFYKEDSSSGNEVEVDNCNEAIADLVSVKSVGTNQNTTRAVQVALAAGCECGQLCLMAETSSGGFNTSKRNTLIDTIENNEIFPDMLICKSGTGTNKHVRTYSGIGATVYSSNESMHNPYEDGPSNVDLSLCDRGVALYGIKGCNP